MKINLSELTPGQTKDDWYNLQPVNLTTRSDMGSMRVSVRFLHEVIMPAKEYSSLKEVCIVRKLS
jgi:Ras GTPase-activating protein 1